METRKVDEPPKTNLNEQANAVEKAYDPGWNDPPPMTYESASGPVKKGILNKPKRIAFPLDASHSPTGLSSSPRNVSSSSMMPNLSLNSSNQSPVPPLCTPPRHSGFPPTSAANMKTISTDTKVAVDNTSSNDTAAPNSEHSLESVLAVFNKILDTINESKDVNEIKKRLGVMSQMWKSSKLDVKVQHQMFLLAEALEKGRIDDANEIQKSLVVNHTGQCSTWMAGVRKLVQYSSTENPSLVKTSVGLEQTENIDNDKSASADSDVSDVYNLASKVQNL